MASRLTRRESKFIESIIEGASPADAYREAFNIQNMKRNSLRSLASRLMKKPEVKAALADAEEAFRTDLSYSINWSIERSIRTRLLAIELMKTNIEQRANAIKEEADAIMHSKEMSDSQKEIASAKVRQKVIFGHEDARTITAICESLDRLCRISDAESQNGVQRIVFINDPRDIAQQNAT